MALAATGIHLVLSFNHSLLHLALSGLGTEHSAVHRRRVKFLGALLEHDAGRGLHTVHERQRGAMPNHKIMTARMISGISMSAGASCLPMPRGAWPNTDLSAMRVSAEMATVRPRATTTTSHMGPAVTPATKVRNSEINMPKGGKAPRPSSARTASAAVAGATSTTPWILARLRVPKAC